MMVADQNLPGTDTIVATAVWTILLSIILHGLSASRLSLAYGERIHGSDI